MWSRTPLNARNLRIRQLPRQYAYGQTRIRANMPTNTTLLLALYCHPNDPIASTVLLPTQNTRDVNELEAPIEPDELEPPLPTSEVPQELQYLYQLSPT